MLILTQRRKFLLKIIFVIQAWLFGYSAKGQTQVITTIAGIAGTYTYGGDGGQATNANLWGPSGIAIDTLGNIFVADQYSYRIRKIDRLGLITTIAGNGTIGYSGDGGQATNAALKNPTGLVFDRSGNLLFSDQYNHCVRKISTTGIISTIAGTGIQGYSGDGGQATLAQLTNTGGLIFDKQGNLYIADLGNGCIRKVDTGGLITTFAGTGLQGYSGDGGLATLAELYAPSSFVIDTIDDLYVSDEHNNTIRKINSLGIINTISTGLALNQPEMMALDKARNLYIADYGNNRIVKMNSSGVSSTIVGTGIAGYSGDGGQAYAAELNQPLGIAFDSLGNLYITDYGNSVIRKVSNVGQTAGIKTTDNSVPINLYPNPSNGSFILETHSSNIQTLNISDVNGKVVLSQNVAGKTMLDVRTLLEGVYSIAIINSFGIYNKTLVIVK